MTSPATRSTIRLECRGLTKRFGSAVAVDGFTHAFSDSRIHSIIGPNGAGKSTLLDLVSGFSRPDCGTVLLRGVDVTHFPPHSRVAAGLARTFQDAPVVPGLTVVQHVAFSQRRHYRTSICSAVLGLTSLPMSSQGIVAAALELFGVAEFSDKRLDELSGGQQRLVSLAACWATGADCLAFDEPLSGIDPAMTERILLAIGQLRQTGRMVLLVEHRLDAVRAISDEVVVVAEGRKVLEGTPSQVLDSDAFAELYLGNARPASP